MSTEQALHGLKAVSITGLPGRLALHVLQP